MTPLVYKVGAESWREHLAKEAHRCAFGVETDPSADRFDYALLAVWWEKDRPIGYATVRELSHENAYWQCVGVFEPFYKSVHAQKIAKAGLKVMREAGYKLLFSLVTNENLPALKMAMSLGFRIIGTKTVNGEVLVDLCLDLSKEN